MKRPSERRVVVTGIGIVSPIGIGAADFWTQLLSGTCGLKRITHFDPAGFACQIGGETPAYKIADYVPKTYRKATKVMARDIELAVVAADLAFKDAGLTSKAYSPTPDIDVTRFGCNIGAGLISAELDELTSAMHVAREGGKLDLGKWGSEGMTQLTPLWLLKYLPNMLACHVTIIHGLMGPSNTITCADASSHLAIGEAFRTIARGKADLAICGGAEARINPMGLMRQQLLGRLNAAHNDDPESAVRPFDKAAAGTVFGDGGGLLILEEFEHAKARGAKVYAELVGFAASQDAYSVTEPDPTGRSYAKAIETPCATLILSPPISTCSSRTAWASAPTTPPNSPGCRSPSAIIFRRSPSPPSKPRPAPSPPAAASTPQPPSSRCTAARFRRQKTRPTPSPPSTRPTSPAPSQ